MAGEAVPVGTARQRGTLRVPGGLPTPGNPPKGMSRPLVAAPSGSIQVFRRPSTINATPHWCSPIVYGWWRATEGREVGAPWRSG